MCFFRGLMFVFLKINGYAFSWVKVFKILRVKFRNEDNGPFSSLVV